MKSNYTLRTKEIPAIGADELALEGRLMELEAKGYRCEVREIYIAGERTGFEISVYEKIA